MQPLVDKFDEVPGFDSVEGKFIRLDLDKWIEDNSIKKEGERQGKLNQPSPTTEGLDGTESKIVDWVNDRARKCRLDVRQHLTDLYRDLVGLLVDKNLETVINDAKVHTTNGETAIHQTIQNEVGEINTLFRDVIRTEAARDKLESSANLAKANYDKRKTVPIYILVFFLIEVLLNASLLMEVSVFGLLGSILQMGLISAVNVIVLAFVLGELIRQSNHISYIRKVLSYAVIVLLVGVTTTFNLAIGHFRDSMEVVVGNLDFEVTQVGTVALDRLLSNPLGLESFQSALLSFVGFIFMLAAAFKWYQRDDPYPGYGVLDRQHRSIVKEYDKNAEKVRQKVEVSYRDSQESLDDLLNQIRMSSPRFLEVSKIATDIIGSFKDQIGQYDYDLNYLMEAYRTANRNSRSESSPPHFEKPEIIDEVLKEDLKWESPPEIRDHVTLIQSLFDATTHLQDARREALERVPSSEDILQSPKESINQPT